VDRRESRDSALDYAMRAHDETRPRNSKRKKKKENRLRYVFYVTEKKAGILFASFGQFFKFVHNNAYHRHDLNVSRASRFRIFASFSQRSVMSPSQHSDV